MTKLQFWSKTCVKMNQDSYCEKDLCPVSYENDNGYPPVQKQRGRIHMGWRDDAWEQCEDTKRTVIIRDFFVKWGEWKNTVGDTVKCHRKPYNREDVWFQFKMMWFRQFKQFIVHVWTQSYETVVFKANNCLEMFPHVDGQEVGQETHEVSRSAFERLTVKKVHRKMLAGNNVTSNKIWFPLLHDVIQIFSGSPAVLIINRRQVLMEWKDYSSFSRNGGWQREIALWKLLSIGTMVKVFCVGTAMIPWKLINK